ncbi:MAG: hypothetical protein U5L96_12590 [Owenweeksia sp.]|nr:hypothetical protein [Owenweeksia sp.]
MKILFVARSTLFHQPGGDTVQVQQTAHFLRQKGVEVHIGLAGENLPIEQFELVHFFNLIRPADLRPDLKPGTAPGGKQHLH